jgi:nitrogen-specific signal transduction histidine kinase
MIDLTEQKRLEAQLRQAQKLEAIGQLAGGVAHDFNNILTAVSGYGSLLDMKLPPDSPLKEYVSEILKAVERGSNLAKGLLAFSRKQPGNPQAVDLNDIVKLIIKLLTKLIREDIRIETRLSEEELIIMADSGHIEQIIMNLATNARDAMPEGGVLTIKTEKVYIDERFRDIHGYGKPGEYALLSVSDTGTGMDENVKARIFEPFFTTKEEGKGTGLGLAIVYGLVKQYNGYINVYSEPGKGSTFKIYIPLYTAEGKTDLSQRKQVVFTKGLGETVLLVDDDPGVRESIRHVLEFAGYRVIEAPDGVEALEIFRQKVNEIDLVITDLIMPRKNGKDFYDDIKAIKPSQKVIFISGHTADSLYRQYLPEGGVIVFKPVLPSEFLRKIREQFE